MDRYVAFLRGMNLGGREHVAASKGKPQVATIRTKGTIDQIAAKYFD